MLPESSVFIRDHCNRKFWNSEDRIEMINFGDGDFGINFENEKLKDRKNL